MLVNFVIFAVVCAGLAGLALKDKIEYKNAQKKLISLRPTEKHGSSLNCS